MDPENKEDGVISPDSQAGEETQSQTERPAEPDPAGGGEKEQRVPYARFKEAVEKERSRFRDFQEKEYGPLKKQFEDLNQRMLKAELARMQAMGFYEPEQPKPITQAELDKFWSDKEKAIREENLRLYHSQHIKGNWPAVQSKYPLLAKRVSFQETVLTRYAANPDKSIQEHADSVAQEFEAYYSEKSASAAKEREEELRPDRRVVPSGRGAGGGGGSKSKDSRPKSVSEKILAGLKAAKEG